MNTRIAVISVGVVALVVFAAAAWFYPRVQAPVPSNSPVVATFEEAGYVRPHSPVIGPLDAPVTTAILREAFIEFTLRLSGGPS